MDLLDSAICCDTQLLTMSIEVELHRSVHNLLHSFAF